MQTEHFDFRFYRFGRQCWSLQFLLWGDGDLSSACKILAPDLSRARRDMAAPTLGPAAAAAAAVASSSGAGGMQVHDFEDDDSPS